MVLQVPRVSGVDSSYQVLKSAGLQTIPLVIHKSSHASEIHVSTMYSIQYLTEMGSLKTIGDASGSLHSTPNTSPTGSLLRGQPGLLEALGSHAISTHLETLYRQNEHQRQILTELSAGIGLKAVQSSKIHGEGGTFFAPTPAGQPLTFNGGNGINLSSGSSVGSGLGGASGTSGSVPGGIERQLQAAVRDNEILRRENEALKRELDRLRRGGP